MQKQKILRVLVKVILVLAVSPMLSVNPVYLHPAEKTIIETAQAKLPQAPQEETTEEAIEFIIKAFSMKYDYPFEKAYWLAYVESRLNPKAVNKEGSSAKGLYMFVNSSWKALCEGDVLDPYDNADCAIRLLSEGKKSHWLADRRVPSMLKKHGVTL